MPEKFISVPVTDLDGNNLPTTLANTILHSTPNFTGLVNGVGRRAFVLQNPSPSFTPIGAAAVSVLGNYNSVLNGGGVYLGTGYITLHSLASSGSARKVFVFMGAAIGGGLVPDPTGIECDIAGQTTSLEHGTAAGINRLKGGWVYSATVPAGTSGAIRVRNTVNEWSNVSAFIVEAPSAATLGAPTEVNDIAQNGSADISQTAAAGSYIVVWAQSRREDGAETGATSWSANVEEEVAFQFTNYPNGGVEASYGIVKNVSAGTVTITASRSGETGNQIDIWRSYEITV